MAAFANARNSCEAFGVSFAEFIVDVAKEEALLVLVVLVLEVGVCDAFVLVFCGTGELV